MPQAIYLPPVKCGDIINLISSRPSVIAIIDGIFESHAAVWHKEILCCIENGIHVVGASSMGALRAAELSQYGMKGIGDIFELFNDSTLNDDDEVAVAHTPCERYEVLSDAMINIRFTLDAAVKNNIIDTQCSDVITSIAKNLYYRDRTLVAAIKVARDSGVSQKTCHQLLLWLNKGGFVDKKKEDACKLLAYLSNYDHELNHIHTNVKMNKTTYIRNMIFDRISQHQQKSNTKCCYLTHHLSRLLACIYTIAKNNESSLQVPDTRCVDWLNIHDKIANNKWMVDNDLSLDELHALRERVNCIEKLLNSIHRVRPNLVKDIEHLFYLFLRMTDHYTAYQLDRDEFTLSVENRVLRLLAPLWAIVAFLLSSENYSPSEEAIEHYATKFRKKRNLYTVESLQAWIKLHELSASGFRELIALYATYSFIVSDGNVDIVGIFEFDEISEEAYLDAMRLSGSYIKLI